MSSFEEATTVVVRMNSILALRNLEYPSNKVKFLSTLLYCTLVTCIYTTSMLYVDKINLQRVSNITERVIYVSLTIIFHLGYLCTIILGLYYSKDTLALRERIAKVDESFGRLGSPVRYRDLIHRVLIMGLVCILNVIIMLGLYTQLLLQLHRNLPYLFSTTLRMLIRSIPTIVLYDFLTYVNWLELRLKQINDFLRTLLADLPPPKKESKKFTLKAAGCRSYKFMKSFNLYASDFHFQRTRLFPLNATPKHESQAANKVHLLRQVRFVHLKLCNVVKMVNKIFDTQLMILSTVVLMHLTTASYFVFNRASMSFNTDAKVKNNLRVYLCHLLSNAVNIILACYSCERAEKEANKIRKIIHEYSAHDFNAEVKDEILQLSLQISLSQFGSSKSNLFRLNYAFIRGCISFAMTYLIVIMQWSLSLE